MIEIDIFKILISFFKMQAYFTTLDRQIDMLDLFLFLNCAIENKFI